MLNKKLCQLHWVDIFPEDEYLKGMKKILSVLNPKLNILRSNPNSINLEEAIEMIRDHGFYNRHRNPMGVGIYHDYELKRINSERIVFDYAAFLSWQQGVSDKSVNYPDAEKYIECLNNQS